ncbi:hypothetical protein JTB14_035007 [Gonioctena quinquepunctata]|nr:hypothetical protein JTB14_035007 [Gonioctena quinquepunctata]
MLLKLCQFWQIGKVNERISASQEAGCIATVPSLSRYVTRAHSDGVDIIKCICSQSERQVILDPMNETISELANYDHQLFIRINCMPCLIASEVEYHNFYIVKAKRSQKEVQMQMEECRKINLPMIQMSPLWVTFCHSQMFGKDTFT